MPDETTPATTDADTLKEHYLTALRGGASLAELGVFGEKLWPGTAPAAPPALREGRPWTDGFVEKLAADYHIAPAGEDRIAPARPATPPGLAPGPLRNPRDVIAQINVELEQGQGHLRESRRQELLRQRDLAYQQAYAETDAATTAARAVDRLSQPALDKLAETELTPEQEAALRAQGVTIIEWPDPPDDREWNMPALNAVAAQLVRGRGIAPADLTRWVARGAALAQQEPGDVSTLDAAVIADARFALQAFLPERTMRVEVEKFLEETGLANDEAFIRELAAKGAPLRQELEEARRDRYRLGTLNAGSRESADTAAAHDARYRNIYGER